MILTCSKCLLILYTFGNWLGGKYGAFAVRLETSQFFDCFCYNTISIPFPCCIYCFCCSTVLSRKHGVCIRKWRKLQGQLQGQSDTGFIWRKKEKVLDIDKLSSLLKVLIFCFLSFILAIFPSCQRSACSSFFKSLNFLRHEFKQHLYYILFFFMGIELLKNRKKSDLIFDRSGGQTSKPEIVHIFFYKKDVSQCLKNNAKKGLIFQTLRNLRGLPAALKVRLFLKVIFQHTVLYAR